MRFCRLHYLLYFILSSFFNWFFPKKSRSKYMYMLLPCLWLYLRIYCSFLNIWPFPNNYLCLFLARDEAKLGEHGGPRERRQRTIRRNGDRNESRSRKIGKGRGRKRSIKSTNRRCIKGKIGWVQFHKLIFKWEYKKWWIFTSFPCIYNCTPTNCTINFPSFTIPKF